MLVCSGYLGLGWPDTTWPFTIGSRCYRKRGVVHNTGQFRQQSDNHLRFGPLLEDHSKSSQHYLLRDMALASAWASLGLTAREMKKARAEAGHFLGDHPPKWNDMGFDRQKARSVEFLQHLRDTENNCIADKFMQGEDTLLEFLRTRTKTIRNKKVPQPSSKSES